MTFGVAHMKPGRYILSMTITKRIKNRTLQTQNSGQARINEDPSIHGFTKAKAKQKQKRHTFMPSEYLHA